MDILELRKRRTRDENIKDKDEDKYTLINPRFDFLIKVSSSYVRKERIKMRGADTERMYSGSRENQSNVDIIGQCHRYRP